MSKDTGFSITSAERYSLALFELSEENNLLSQIEDQSSSILNLIDQSEDFSNLIKDPTTSQEDLLKVINTISENNKFEPLFRNFLSFFLMAPGTWGTSGTWGFLSRVPVRVPDHVPGNYDVTPGEGSKMCARCGAAQLPALNYAQALNSLGMFATLILKLAGEEEGSY